MSAPTPAIRSTAIWAVVLAIPGACTDDTPLSPVNPGGIDAEPLGADASTHDAGPQAASPLGATDWILTLGDRLRARRQHLRDPHPSIERGLQRPRPVINRYRGSSEPVRRLALPTMRGHVRGMAIDDDGGVVLAGHYGRGYDFGTLLFIRRISPDGDLGGEYLVDDYGAPGYRALATRGDRIIAGGGFLADATTRFARVDALRRLEIE